MKSRSHPLGIAWTDIFPKDELVRCQNRVPEIRVVEHIEHLAAELQSESLGDLGVLGHREIGVQKTRSSDGIAAQITRMAGGQRCRRYRGDTGRHKDSLIREPPRWVSRRLDCARHVGPHSKRYSRAWADGQCGIERIPRLRLRDDTKLPARYEAVSLEGEFVEAAENETVTRVKFRRAIIASRIIGILNDVRLSGRK